MPNSLQSNPSDATADFVQPDWNSKHGTGVAVPEEQDATMSFEEIYESQRQGAKDRLAESE